MGKEYDIEFNNEIERILNTIYNDSIVEGAVKRAIVTTDVRYVEYLEKMELAKRMSYSTGNSFALQLKQNGYEVFEKYGDWNNYYKKVIYKKRKIYRSKELAVKFWWLPVIISLASLAVAIVALIKSN